MTDLAYLAGIFDGEGCAGVYKIKSRGYRPTPIMAVQMTDPEPIRLLRDTFGGYYRKHKPRHMRKPVYHWSVSHRQALKVARALTPFIHNRSKVRQFAKILLHYEVI